MGDRAARIGADGRHDVGRMRGRVTHVRRMCGDGWGDVEQCGKFLDGDESRTYLVSVR